MTNKWGAKGEYGEGKASKRRRPVHPKEPDPFVTTVQERQHVDGLSAQEIAARLEEAGVHPHVIEDLIRDRKTNGGRWRIIQELRR